MSDDAAIRAETAEFFAKAMASGMDLMEATEARCIAILKETCTAAVLAERERCAKIAEAFKPNLDDARSNQQQLADLIRVSAVAQKVEQ